MSIFRAIDAECPVCGTVSRFDLVYSVNVDRRPDLRAAILDRSFQKLKCPSCGDHFRIEPEFTLLHTGGGQFMTVRPSTNLPNWEDVETQSQASFDRFYGPDTDPIAADIGRALNTRVVFGWEAAHEKLVAADAGIDDVTLELAKLALLRSTDDIEVGEDHALRLVGVDEENRIVLGRFATASEEAIEEFRISRDLLAEIEADADDWRPLRDAVAAGSFVDMLRLLVIPEPLPPG